MATAIEIIRANLIGLPTEITDSVIQTVVDSSTSLHNAAISLADSAATLAAGNSEVLKVGTLSIDSSKSADYWLRIKDNLIKRALTNTGVITDPDATVTTGGVYTVQTGKDIPLAIDEGTFSYE